MCAKIQLRVGENFSVKIPISLDFSSTGQDDIINDEFVDIEVEKTINPIIDYEKVRFTPKIDNIDIKILTYNVKMLNDDGEHYVNTTYGDIGFINEDIIYQKNNFLKTFLTLKFYDNDTLTNQNLVSQITIFSKVSNSEDGIPLQVNSLPLTFTVNNPIKSPNGFSEGYYIYHFKSEIEINGPNKELFMRAELNNAKNGVSTKFMTTDRTDLTINKLVDKLHTRYLLKRTNTGYEYTIDKTYNTDDSNSNIVDDLDNVTVNLYEIKVV